MTTQFLTREEMHNRVDYLYDAMEDYHGEEGVAVIGDVAGSVRHYAPSESRDHYKLTAPIAYPQYTFNRYGDGLDRFRESPTRGLFGTILVPKSDLDRPVKDALDGDVEAQEALAAGEVSP